MKYVAEVKRKKGESFESLLRRFTKKIQESGRLLQAKKIMFHKKTPSKTKIHETALRRIEFQKMREYLKKIGKLKEDNIRK